MATGADIVRIALAENGYHDGQGYDELTKYTQSFGINYGIAYCDIFVAWCYEQAGIPLPKMGSWIRSGSQYCPDSWNFAEAHGATLNSWQAYSGSQVIFDWTGTGVLGGESHTEIVETWHDGWLYTVGGNSGPSNVDGFRGTGGVHRHAWSAPAGVGNSLIMGIIDTAKLVHFSNTSGEFTLDAEAKARFDKQDENIDQLIKIMEGGFDPKKNPFGLEGFRDIDAKLQKIADHFGVK